MAVTVGLAATVGLFVSNPVPVATHPVAVHKERKAQLLITGLGGVAEGGGGIWCAVGFVWCRRIAVGRCR